jgi:hypothetical protein
MISKCPCQYCEGNIEFDAADFQQSGRGPTGVFGQKVTCPHCQKETLLHLPKPDETYFAKPAANNRMTPCRVCGHGISKSAWWCFECGQLHYSLFRIVLNVMCNIALVSLIFTLLGYVILIVAGGGIKR